MDPAEVFMTSTTHEPTAPTPPPTAAARFGEVVDRLATAAGFDMERGGTGRAKLAEQCGVSVWAVRRWLKGEALPRPPQFQPIAAALGVETQDLLKAAGLIPQDDHANGANQPVPSQNSPGTPDQAADLLGVTDPTLRDMLKATMERAQRLQRNLDQHGPTGEASAARG